MILLAHFAAASVTQKNKGLQDWRLVVVFAEDVAVLQEPEVFFLDASLDGRRHPAREQALLFALLELNDVSKFYSPLSIDFAPK